MISVFQEGGIVVTVAVADVGSAGWGGGKGKGKGDVRKDASMIDC